MRTIGARRILALSSTLWNVSIEGYNLRRSVAYWQGGNSINFSAKLMSSTTSSSSLPEDTTPNKESGNRLEFLEQWIQHDHHAYHLDHLSPQQAYKIRIALVEWYRGNRRKLPWRGDPGPYDGSTAGFAAGTNGKKNGKKRKEGGEGKDIRSFFAKKKKSGEPAKVQPIAKSVNDQNDTKNNNANEMCSNEVTAYGVWVSEIMLQQTRVEAVIPYYLKCESILCY